MIDAYRWFFMLFIWVIPTLTAVSWREAVKAHLSHYRGDSTAKMLGLGSFSPIKNIHPIGSAVSPLLLILKHNDIYAWANKIEVRSSYLNQGRADTILILSSAIAFNFLLALVWAWLAQFSAMLPSGSIQYLIMESCKAGIKVNLVLFVMHLIPLPPLDMSSIVREFMPRYPKSFYASLDSIGHYLIFFALLLDYAQPYLDPILLHLQQLITSLVGA